MGIWLFLYCSARRCPANVLPAALESAQGQEEWPFEGEARQWQDVDGEYQALHHRV
jgi:hypothetical protein